MVKKKKKERDKKIKKLLQEKKKTKLVFTYKIEISSTWNITHLKIFLSQLVFSLKFTKGTTNR